MGQGNYSTTLILKAIALETQRAAALFGWFFFGIILDIQGHDLFAKINLSPLAHQDLEIFHIALTEVYLMIKWTLVKLTVPHMVGGSRAPSFIG